jgi:hypothetical protein
MIFWLMLKVEISYKVVISWRILVSFRGFFWRFGIFFCMLKYLSFHNSSFALRYFLKCKWQGHTQCDTPLVMNWVRTCTGLLVQKVGFQPNPWSEICLSSDLRDFMYHMSPDSLQTLHGFTITDTKSLSCAIMLTNKILGNKLQNT